MKQLFVKLLLCLLVFLPLGCTESDDGNYVEPITIYEKINGEWSLIDLKMVDEFAVANGIEPDEENLSNLFNYENFRIKLNVDEGMQPTTYEVIGDVPPLFEPNGYWTLSSAFQPTNSEAVRIHLYSDAEKTILTDELRITSVPGSNPEMQIQLTRESDGVKFVSYVFNLNATNL